MKVKYGDRKIAEKILKSIEDKAVKVAKSAAPPIATARAESRKRKEADVPKTVPKRRKSGKSAKDAAAEETAESTQDESDAARPSVEAGRSEDLVARPDKHLMASSVLATVVTSGAGVSGIVSLPSILSNDS